MDPIIVRGGGDVATGSIYELCRAGYHVIILETFRPSAIRRNVSFCQAVYEGKTQVEGMNCVLCADFKEAWDRSLTGEPSLLIDPECNSLKSYRPWMLVDGILAKRNTGTTRDMGRITVALGPGFSAGDDVDYVIETKRGHTLGRIIDKGPAIADTGIPGIVGGYGRERVMHSPAAGVWRGGHKIADIVQKGEPIAFVGTEDGTDVPVYASLDGILRGIIQDGYCVRKGLKVADIDPRLGELSNCFTISDKARCVGGSVLLLAARAEHGLLAMKP